MYRAVVGCVRTIKVRSTNPSFAAMKTWKTWGGLRIQTEYYVRISLYPSIDILALPAPDPIVRLSGRVPRQWSVPETGTVKVKLLQSKVNNEYEVGLRLGIVASPWISSKKALSRNHCPAIRMPNYRGQ